MHTLLEKLLSKRGIKDVTELKEEERETFDKWQATLTAKKLEVDDLRRFCEAQKSMIEGRWRDQSNEPMLNERLITQHVVYSLLIEVMEKPSSERAALEKRLHDMLS